MNILIDSAESDIGKYVITKLKKYSVEYLIRNIKNANGGLIEVCDVELCERCIDLLNSNIGSIDFDAGYILSCGYISNKNSAWHDGPAEKVNSLILEHFLGKGKEYEFWGPILIVSQSANVARLSAMCSSLTHFKEVLSPNCLFDDEFTPSNLVSDEEKLKLSVIVFKNILILSGYGVTDLWAEKNAIAISVVHDNKSFTFIGLNDLSDNVIRQIREHHPDDLSYVAYLKRSSFGPAPTICNAEIIINSEEKRRLGLLKGIIFDGPIPINGNISDNLTKCFDMISESH